MRLPTSHELILGLIAMAVVGVMKLDARATAAKEAELRTLRTEQAEVHRENDVLRKAKAEIDQVAAAEFVRLSAAIEDAEARARVATRAGRQTYTEILEALPDSAPELRALIDRREREVETALAVKDEVISGERSASSLLRRQLSAANGLLAGVEDELGLANGQIEIFESLRDDGLSSLESAGLGLGAYLVATDGLGATTLEGLIAGGGTYLVTQGVSKLVGWIL